MTAFEWLKTLRMVVALLLVWDLVLSFCLVAGYMEKQTINFNQQICNLELIPDSELMEVE